MANNLAHPYVNALFDLASTNSSFDLWLDDLNGLATAASDVNFTKLVNNPTVSKNDVLETLLSFTRDSGPELKNFLSLLMTEDRLMVLPEIYHLFKEKVDLFRSSATAIIQSAFPMEESEKNEFASILSKKLGKAITVDVEVNKDLVGGIKILINDLVIDASIKGGLEKMAAKII